ncbi:Rho termination factor N-terminal domain-containing protein [Nostoc sp. UHCC 0870]|uniref:Rho termination factor N-terminal domain-containing protein n=1 Tax=Nostoc sp. UHCC 0870 TaxID=2914041 RepID=UPI001EDCAC14|nr:Rho termination factor N-terminal domain-containing protein [Nostoc sp. UHCC 0870]UKP01355.1 Rho termination factor N-terminal domain-containing protein [Nostoc sp. UHCC 0870]
MKIDDIGNLMYLYRKEISSCVGTDAPEFLIKSTAQALNNLGGRNWIPIIVKETGEDQYEVIGNSFIYAVAEEARLDKVWCIIADDSKETSEVTKILAGEIRPKINLSYAGRDEIKSALEYLIEKPDSVLKRVNLSVATNRIEEAPRKYWTSLDPITTLKCQITKGVKLNALKEVFELTPEPLPDVIKDPIILRTLTVTELRKMAKKRGIPGCSRKGKDELVQILSQ